MNKRSLIIETARKTGISTEAVDMVIVTAIDSVKRAIERGEKVRINNFCTIWPTMCRERKARDIYNANEIVLPPTVRPKFYVSKKWIKQINNEREKRAI